MFNLEMSADVSREAPESHSGGRRFEPVQLRHSKTKNLAPTNSVGVFHLYAKCLLPRDALAALVLAENGCDAILYGAMSSSL